MQYIPIIYNQRYLRKEQASLDLFLFKKIQLLMFSHIFQQNLSATSFPLLSFSFRLREKCDESLVDQSF